MLTDKQRPKAEAFWAAISTKRKLAGHCCRCGKPHTGPLKQCDHCRTYHKQYRKVRAAKRLRLGSATLAQFAVEFDAHERRLASLELAVARLQLAAREAYKRGWARGYRKGCNHRGKNFEGLCGEHFAHRRGEKTSGQELRQLCSAWGKG